MVKKKACKRCKIFVDGNECPLCQGSQFTINWQGRISIINKDKSFIAGKIGVEKNGEYAIKVR